MFGHRRRHAVVGAVHPSQAQGVLTYLGIEQELASRRIACVECGAALTPSTLAAAQQAESGLLLCCHRLPCLETFHER